MNLLEKDIEDIIYNSPWLLDERYVIPSIKGSRNEYGRQINIGRNGLNRYVDLLFKDTRDNRPVIVELKKEALGRESIAQILEYRGLVVSMEDDDRDKWQNEFGQNYYCPKLILIGTSASDEVKISANLAGIEVRTLLGIEDLEINFGEISQINNKLNDWNMFLNTGNRTFEDRDEWISQIYDWTKVIIDEYPNKSVSTTNKLYKTSFKDSWIEGITFPFINIPFKYNGEYLCGMYEYCNDKTRFSDEYFYFDFLVQRMYFSSDESDELLNEMQAKVSELLADRGYSILTFDELIAAVKIPRRILNDYNDFKMTIIKLIDDAVFINDEIVKMFGDFEIG